MQSDNSQPPFICDEYDIVYKKELSKIYNLPKARCFPYTLTHFVHLMPDSVRMWLLLEDDDIYTKLMDECSIHILINSLLLTIVIPMMISFNEIDEYTTNHYVYFITGTVSMTSLLCAIANIMIIITNVNKYHKKLIRYMVAKNITNISLIFSASAFAFYSFLCFMAIGLYITKPRTLSIICVVIFAGLCGIFSLPYTLADRMNCNGNPRLSLNFYPNSKKLRAEAELQMRQSYATLNETNPRLLINSLSEVD